MTDLEKKQMEAMRSNMAKVQAENDKLKAERGDYIKRMAVAAEVGRLGLPKGSAQVLEAALLADAQVEYAEDGKATVLPYDKDGLPAIDRTGRPIGLGGRIDQLRKSDPYLFDGGRPQQDSGSQHGGGKEAENWKTKLARERAAMLKAAGTSEAAINASRSME